MSNLILETIEENIGLIKINRAEVYNALTKEAKLELVKAIRSYNKDPKIKAIILTGEGKAFCTGQDLNDRTVQGEDSAVDLGHTLETEWNPLINAIRSSKKPVIAAINGVCAGAGLSVAVACDLITCAPKVKFISGFSKLGLAPDAGSSYVFTRALGYQKTLEFFFFNEALHAQELQECGIISFVADTYFEEALSMARKIAALAPYSIELIKKNAQAAQDLSFSNSLQRETETQRFLGASQDYKEGLSAFFDKRAPNFDKKDMH